MNSQVIPNSSYYIIKSDIIKIYNQTGDLLETIKCEMDENSFLCDQILFQFLDPSTKGAARVNLLKCMDSTSGRIVGYYDKNGNQICIDEYNGQADKDAIVREMLGRPQLNRIIDWQYIDDNNIPVIDETTKIISGV